MEDNPAVNHFIYVGIIQLIVTKIFLYGTTPTEGDFDLRLYSECITSSKNLPRISA